MSKPYQPKTGQKCSCRRGVERDNCPNCEGTGWMIDYPAIRAAIRARTHNPDTGMTPQETAALHRQGICPMD